MVSLSDPESIRTVFAAKGNEMHAGAVNRLLRVVVGNSSVLLLDGQEHMRHRKLLLPSFHGERMRHYGATHARARGEPRIMRAGSTPSRCSGIGRDEAYSLHHGSRDQTRKGHPAGAGKQEGIRAGLALPNGGEVVGRQKNPAPRTSLVHPKKGRLPRAKLEVNASERSKDPRHEDD